MEGIETMDDRMDKAKRIWSLVLFGYEVDPLSFLFDTPVSSSDSSSFFPQLPVPMRRFMAATIEIQMQSTRMKKSPTLVIDTASEKPATAAAAAPPTAAGSPERVKGRVVVVAISFVCESIWFLKILLRLSL